LINRKTAYFQTTQSPKKLFVTWVGTAKLQLVLFLVKVEDSFFLFWFPTFS
jgi:hypothetical protein